MADDLPVIPPPTPRRLVTGNAQLDRASERMPYEQRRVVQRLRDLGQLVIAPLAGPMAHRDPVTGQIVIDPLVLEHAGGDVELAKTLTHEATHALQPRGWFAEILQRTRDPLPAEGAMGHKPREREARLAEKQVLEGDEPAFRRWYAGMSAKHQLARDPDDPAQFYDYRAAFRAGATPDREGHWPSRFKKPGHPNMVVGGFHVQTGQRVPGTNQASEQELIRLGWDPAFAARVSGRR